MQALLEHLPTIVTIALILSETAAAIVQLVFPDNKGLSGILATVIKFLQSVKASSDAKKDKV